ncbi:polymorphic toxin-type HINT domain-containing protein [Spongiactinospora sp. TRM90649]|uniref:polymorphic toxin-type HINT domain-containing protein n=1 Tax=Spongiactinospora sp. TRM90649 TaxID=3031114 RepID=UPI0023F97CC0|nr:polymorphic toxin-type HINT domain-containing protein [Spongiactinospora sp. TRM90649]MDF5751879.1 polymorphic toxin-type HINT domain-containing protein [Spongiactinospora sp. TRM90649]
MLLRTRAPITTSYTYNAEGLLKTTTSPLGNEPGANKADYTTTYFYDADDNPVRVRHPYPGGGFTDRDIKTDPLDRTSSKIDELNKESTFGRDNNGQITSTTDNLGRRTRMAYDDSGRQTEITDAGGKTTKTEYDKAGNPIKETNAVGGVTTWKYDDDGLLVAVTEPRGNVEGADPDRYTTRYEYDRAGNQTKIIDPLGNASTATYDGVNRLIATTDAKGRTTHQTFNEDNLLRTVHTPETPYSPYDPEARSTVYTYSIDGMLESVRDPLGRYTRMAYDDAGRLITRADPLSRRVEVTYDAESNPRTAITINGPEWVSPEERAKRTVSIDYDILSRRTKTTLGSQGPVHTFAYDAKDRTTAYGDPTGVREVVYDDEDQIKTVTRKTAGQSDQTFTYAYDERGNITSRPHPDGTKVTADYDGDSRITSHNVSGGVAGGASEWTFKYDPAGRRVSTTLPTGGLTEKRAYDESGRLTSIATANGDAAPVSAFDLTLDQVGNPTKVVTRRGDRTEEVAYAYDSVDRVTSACYSATTCGTGTQAAGRIDYTYDLMGNRLSQKRTGTAGNDTTTYTYDVADQLLRETVAKPDSTVSKNFAYDVNGNQITAGPDRTGMRPDNGPTTNGDTAPSQGADPGPSPEDVAKAQQLQNKSVLDVVLEAGGQILMEILGINDILNCLKGDLGACVSMVVGALPWGKIFKAPKIIEAIWKAGKAVINFFQQLKWARAILRGAAKAAEAAKAAAAKAAREAAVKRAAAKAAAEQLAKKLAAETAARAKALAAKAKAKTKPPAANPKSRGAKADSCPNSFAAGTLVLLANGTAKPIEKVALGEKVLATDPETGETRAKPVVRQIAGEGDKKLVKITIDTDGDTGSATSDLVATDGHPIWVQSERAWLKADRLKPGMWLRTSAGTYVQVTATKTSTARQRVHNFTIADINTYYVLTGATPVLVHNCDNLQEYADSLREQFNKEDGPFFAAKYTSPSGQTYYGHSGHDMTPTPGGAVDDLVRRFTPSDGRYHAGCAETMCLIKAEKVEGAAGVRGDVFEVVKVRGLNSPPGGAHGTSATPCELVCQPRLRHQGIRW